LAELFRVKNIKSADNLKKMISDSQKTVQRASKLLLNYNAIIFKTNVEEELTKKQIEEGVSNANIKQGDNSGARYECIYKNLLREIR
jgi:hypothetical protein